MSPRPWHDLSSTGSLDPKNVAGLVVVDRGNGLPLSSGGACWVKFELHCLKQMRFRMKDAKQGLPALMPGTSWVMRELLQLGASCCWLLAWFWPWPLLGPWKLVSELTWPSPLLWVLISHGSHVQLGAGLCSL